MQRTIYFSLSILNLKSKKCIKKNKMLATHQQKLFEVLLYVLVLNGEHGSSQLVYGRS